MIDLAARRLGGVVLAASGEYFALLDPHEPVSDPGAYTVRGKLMDGWESRHRHVTVTGPCCTSARPASSPRRSSTRSTSGANAPERVARHGCVAPSYMGADELDDDAWFPLVAPTPVRAGHRNRIPADVPTCVTYVRLSIEPDGGVARLRLPGNPVADLRSAADRYGSLDLAAHGGTVVAASEEFFAPGRTAVARLVDPHG